ncbi:MAG: hypothetical protein ACOCQX_04470 [Candidatus Nanoarchaeia archaeon]
MPDKQKKYADVQFRVSSVVLPSKKGEAYIEYVGGFCLPRSEHFPKRFSVEVQDNKIIPVRTPNQYLKPIFNKLDFGIYKEREPVRRTYTFAQRFSQDIVDKITEQDFFYLNKKPLRVNPSEWGEYMIGYTKGGTPTGPKIGNNQTGHYLPPGGCGRRIR